MAPVGAPLVDADDAIRLLVGDGGGAGATRAFDSQRPAHGAAELVNLEHGSLGARPCGVLSVAAGGESAPHGLLAWVAASVEAAPGPPAGDGTRDASTGLMSEQKLVVPTCPRRGNGHWWRFDRERSTGIVRRTTCATACGLVRLTSYRTGQVVRYACEGAGDGA